MTELQKQINRLKACQESCRKRQDELLALAKEATEKGYDIQFHKIKKLINNEINEYNRLQDLIDSYQD